MFRQKNSKHKNRNRKEMGERFVALPCIFAGIRNFKRKVDNVRYHNITKDDMLNGDGLRVVVWVSGCSHCCKECQNPLTWDPNSGVPFDDNVKKEIFEQLELSYIDGITFSGGDPLHVNNITEVTELAKEIREKYPEKTIWLYSGDSWEFIKLEEIAKYLDVLVDGEFQVENLEKSLKWKGSSNQRVIDVQESLKTGDIVLHTED